MKNFLIVLGVGGVAVVGYVIYKKYNPTASKKNNTVLTDIGFGFTAATSAVGLGNQVSSWFNHGSNSAGSVSGWTDSNEGAGLNDLTGQ